MCDTKTFKLVDLNCEENISKELAIEARKQYSRLSKEAANLIKLTTCLTCGSQCDSFCNSHSIPSFVLQNISENGKLFRMSKLLNVDPLQETYGVNEISTFKLICRKCDSVLFQKYENEVVLKNNINNFLLNDIALKNYLKEYYNKNLYSNLPINKLQIKNSPISAQIEPWKYDSRLALKRIYKIIKANSKQDLLYYSFFEICLDYTVPIAFQSKATLISDLNGAIINNVYKFDSNYELKDLHICIFPLKSKTKILMFVENHDKRYSAFRKQFSKLQTDEKLKIINYILFLYSDDIYISPNVDKKIFSNPLLKEVASINATYQYRPMQKPDQSEIIKLAASVYNLSKAKDIPNLLSEKYKL